MNITENEIPNLLEDFSSKTEDQFSSIILDIIRTKFPELNCNLVILDFLKQWNYQVDDSEHRNIIVENLKSIKFYDIEPHILKDEILKNTSEEYLEFSFAILTQLNIPASFQRVAALEISRTKKDFSKKCLNKIISSSETSALEKYLALKFLLNINSIVDVRRIDIIQEFDWFNVQEDYYEILQSFCKNEEEINVNMKCTYFFQEYNRKTDKKYYCGFHNNSKYFICNAESKDQLQEEDCIAFISVLARNYEFLNNINIEMLDFWTFVKIAKHSFYATPLIKSKVSKFICDSTVEMVKKIILLKNLRLILSDLDFAKYYENLNFQSCMMDSNSRELFQKLI